MKPLFITVILVLLNGCSNALVKTAVSAAHTGTDIYCGSLTQTQRLAFRQAYNQESQHQLSIQCAADLSEQGSL